MCLLGLQNYSMSSEKMRIDDIGSSGDEASSRARELLNSMKEKREQFSQSVSVHKSSGSSATPPKPPSQTYKSTSIAQHLIRESLKERKHRLAMVSANSEMAKLLKFSCPAPSMSEHSTHTSVTEDSTAASSETDHFPITVAAKIVDRRPPSIADVQRALDCSSPPLNLDEETSDPEVSSTDTAAEFKGLKGTPLTPVREEEATSQSPIPKVVSSHALNHDPVLDHPMPPAVEIRPRLDLPEREERYVSVPELVDCPTPVMAEAISCLSPENKKGKWGTPEKRSSYLGDLYRTSPDESTASTGKYLRKRNIHQQLRESTETTKDLLHVAVVDDHDSRRKLLEALQEDVQNIKAAYVKMETSPVTLPSIDRSSVSEDESSTSSSFDFTSNSDTSGWISSGESVGSDSGLPCTPPNESLLNMNLHMPDSDDSSEDMSLLSAIMIVPTEKERRDNILSEPVLFTEERTAERLCLGGLYGIALASGWDESESIQVHAVPETRPRDMHESTDNRCGTRGSLYDLSVRSGAKIQVLPPQQGRRNEIARVKNLALGGLYNLAMRSGLDPEEFGSRKPVSVSVKQQDQLLGSLDVMPESVSDRECGAWGSMKIFGVDR